MPNFTNLFCVIYVITTGVRNGMYVHICWQVLRELCSNCDEACVNSKNIVGRTALHIASLMGLVEAAEVLINHGAKVLFTDHITWLT